MPELANILWRSLSGTHAPLAEGTTTARRYRRGLPALLGFADAANPDFAALAPYCTPGERFYCAGWSGPQPPGWAIDVDTTMCAMLWAGGEAKADHSTNIVRLGEAHVPQMVALAALTKPGPYPDRPMEMGEWYGILDGERLVAMAGERMHDRQYREVSGVCTLPGYEGRGYARRLTERVVLSQLARGLEPFLHVASANTRALKLYERMGFRVDLETPLRVVSFNG